MDYEQRTCAWRKLRRSTDCDVTRSSTDLDTSTSLIHIIAIVGHPGLEHTSVLRLVFQHWTCNESGILSKCKSEIRLLGYVPSNKFENKFLMYYKEDSRSKTSWQSAELVLYYPAVLFSILLFFPKICLYQSASICKKTMPNSLISQRALRMVHLEKMDLQKRVLMNTMSSVSRLLIPLVVRILKG